MGFLGGAVKWTFTGVWPPKDPNDADSFRMWMLAVGLSIIIWSTALAATDAIIFGVFPMIFPGFVPASVLTDVNKRLDGIVYSLAKNEVRSDYSAYCKLKIKNDINALDGAWQDYQTAQRTFRTVNNGYELALLPCEELVN